MLARVLDILYVLVSLVAVYSIPTLVTARRLRAHESGLTTWLDAAALGLASQAALGLLWNDLVGRAPFGAAAVYLGFWGGIAT